MPLSKARNRERMRQARVQPESPHHIEPNLSRLVQPTDEQGKKFWEACGFRWKHLTCPKHSPNLCHWAWIMPDGTEANKDYDLLPIDLNNLFKYAVPMPPSYNPDIRLIQSITFDYGTCSILDVMGVEYVGEHPDPALALFWALYKILVNEG